MYNPTSYFNPGDYREFLLKEEDELVLGVPSLSTMWYFGDVVLDVVFVPVHIPAQLPSKPSFWHPAIQNYPFDITIDETETLPISPKNFGYGARISKSIFGADVSISGYHGPDKEPLAIPDHTNLYLNKPVEMVIVPRHFLVTKFGFDFSIDFNKFVIQCEAAYSPNKKGIPDLSSTKTYSLPIEEKESHYVSYSTGFNYFIPLNRIIEGHEGDTVLTMEWFQSKYFDTSLEKPLFSDMIVGRIEDSYFSGKLKLYLTGAYDAREQGFMVWPRVQYDFQNGLAVELSYVYINGKEDSMIGYYRDKDCVILRLHYEY